MGLIVSNADVISQLGQEAVTDLTDDGTESTLVAEAVERAEASLFAILAFKYSPTNLALSPICQM